MIHTITFATMTGYVDKMNRHMCKTSTMSRTKSCCSKVSTTKSDLHYSAHQV